MPVVSEKVSAPLFFASILLLATTCAVLADDLPTVAIEMKDGVVTPPRLEVPAGRRFLVEITNSGTTPAEFESRDLKKETGVFPGQKTSMVIKKLDPGEYAFFDDFHPGSPPTILVAK